MLSGIRKRIRSILLVLSFIGPGIITAAVDNDAGGITTYSVAGAEFGYAMLWAVIPVTLILIVIQEMCARMGVVSGKGLSDLIRESYGAKVTFYILIGLVVANLGTIIANFAGIAGSLEILNVPRYVSIPLAAVLIWFIITKGSYKSAERIFMIAAVIYFAYVISGFLAKPDWMQVFKSTATPTIQLSSKYLLVLIGFIGTTITPWMQFYLQSSVVEKGVKIENYKYTKWDVIIGSVMTDIITFFIVIASAATLFVNGIHITNASDAAMALAPFAGKFAELLFAIGLLNASLLGATIVPIATSYYICEGLGFESGVNKSFREARWFYGIFTALIILGAVPILFPNLSLVRIMLVSQVINGILLAPILIFIVLLVNKKWLMGQYVNKTWHNIVAWATVGLLTLLSAILVATSLF